MHDHFVAVLHHDLVVVQLVPTAVPAAIEGAEVVIAGALGVAVKGHHIRPDLIHIRLLGVVVHIRGVAAGGAHVDFQTDDITLPAQALLVLVQHKELQMDKPGFDAEGFHRGKARLANLLRQLLHQIVDGVASLVHNVHQRQRRNVAGFKEHLPLGIHNAVEGLNIAVDIFFHDIDGAVLRGHKPADILVGEQLVGVVGPHAVVRLDHYRVAHDVRKLQRILQSLHQVVPGSGNTGLGVVLLHNGLKLDSVHLMKLGAGGDIEFRPQPGIPHEPILIVGLQPVDFAIFEGKIGHGLENLVVILQAGNLIVFMEGVPQFLKQAVIGAVADAQDPHSVILQFPTEFPVGHGKVGGDKNKVFHVLFLFSKA